MSLAFDTLFSHENWPSVTSPFWALVFLALGCIVGSFLNVCIYRMPLDLSVVSPPSHCPHCKYSIPFYLNIPLVTWLTLRGRCKNCEAPISPRYFAVELLTGVTFLACWIGFSSHSPGLALAYAAFIAGLIVATFIDFEHFIIPDEITLGGAVAGFAFSLLVPELHGTINVGTSLGRSAAGITVGAGLVYGVLRLGKLLFGRQTIPLPTETNIVFTETSICLPDQEIPYDEIFYRKSDTIVLQAQMVELIDRSYANTTVRLSPTLLQIGEEKIAPETVPHLEVRCTEIVVPREAMGLGDVKFMATIGAFTGWQGALFTLMVSSLIGAAVGLTLILLGKREWSSRLPYGPYLALAAVLWIFGGRNIILHLLFR